MEADSDLADRMCIVTREVMDEAVLLRFVRSPDGVAVPDLARKLPGRGVWVTLNRSRVAEAVKKHLFSKGFSEETRSPDGLPDMVARLLRQHALSTFSAGQEGGGGGDRFHEGGGGFGQGPGEDSLPCRRCRSRTAAASLTGWPVTA